MDVIISNRFVRTLRKAYLESSPSCGRKYYNHNTFDVTLSFLSGIIGRNPLAQPLTNIRELLASNIILEIGCPD
jgi:hypothetical protein